MSGDGVGRPYRISLVEVRDKSLRLSAGDNASLESITTAFVQRLTPGVAEQLLAGAPNVDAMFDNPVKRCGTRTTMAAPDTVLTLRVSISENQSLIVSLDASKEIHVDDVIELLVDTIDYLEQS